MRNAWKPVGGLLSALVGFSLLPSTAQARQNRADIKEAPDSHIFSTSPPSVWSDKYLPEGWERLPHLHTHTTLLQRDITIEDAVQMLKQSTGAKLRAQGAEVLLSHVTLRYRDAPLADVLRGIAATYNLIWMRTPKQELVLQHRRDSHDMDLMRPHTEAEASMFLRGHALVSQIARLPADLQQALQRKPADSTKLMPEGVAFSELPAPVQESLHSMYAARLEDAEAKERPLHIGLESLPALRVRMDVNTQEGFTGYRFLLFDNEGGTDMWTHVFHDARESYSVVAEEALTSSPAPTYPEDADAQQEALASDPRLKTRVSLPPGKYTIQEVLYTLAGTAQIQIAAPLNYGHETRRAFQCKDELLGEALPRLCRAYAYTAGPEKRPFKWSWHWRKDSQFSFHWLLDKDSKQAGKQSIKQAVKTDRSQGG